MAVMRLGLRLSLLLPLVALIACGSNSPSFGTIGTPSGDWILNLESTTASGYFPGALTIQGSNVSGVFQYVNPSVTCTPGTQPITVTGTVNASGSAINLTSSSFGTGSVATFTIHLPLIQSVTPNSTYGTVQIAGGNCALASTVLNIYFVNYTGNYSGTLTEGTASISANLNVTEGSANSAGQFMVTGGIALSGPSCNLSSTSLSGLITGFSMQLSGNGITVTADSTVSPIRLTVSGTCGSDLIGTVE